MKKELRSVRKEQKRAAKAERRRVSSHIAPPPVPIRFVTFPEFENWTSLEPGSARWVMDQSGEIAGLNFTCPGGCGSVGFCHVGLKHKPDRPSSWNWNGDKEKPTLTPSILSKLPHGCGWHGYLTDGEFRVRAGEKNQCQGPRS